MENGTISTIIAFLGGAVTALLPKVFDYLFEGKKSRLQTKRFYFEKKIEVLQAYVATCTQLSAQCFNNAVMCGQVKLFDFFNEMDHSKSAVIDNLISHIKRSSELNDQLSALSSAASMYIDLKTDTTEAYLLIAGSHANTADISKLMKDVWDVIAKYNLHSEPSLNQTGANDFFKARDRYRSHIQAIESGFDMLKNKVNESIQQVRQDIKEFKV